MARREPPGPKAACRRHSSASDDAGPGGRSSRRTVAPFRALEPCADVLVVGCWRRCCGDSTTAATAAASPSYVTIATKAECVRSVVAEALKVLEWAGVLTWQHRIARIQVREHDLFGQWARRWRVIRTSKCLRVPRSATASGRCSCFQVRKSDRDTESRNSNTYCQAIGS
jgi:hypothetical protein